VPTDLGPCIAIAAGYKHTVAIRKDGVVRAWGYNSYAQCNIPADLGTCTAIAAGYHHSVALRPDGAVRVWGGNNYGQRNAPAGLGACSAIAAGYYHTVALRNDGTVRCWGAGTTDTGNSPQYGQSVVPPGIGKCKAIEAGAFAAAVNAEYRRGQALGKIYIERKEIRHGTIDSMSKEEVERKLDELKRLYGPAPTAIIDATTGEVTETLAREIDPAFDPGVEEPPEDIMEMIDASTEEKED
jgi:hypothetical protein